MEDVYLIAPPCSLARVLHENDFVGGLNPQTLFATNIVQENDLETVSKYERN